MSKYIKEYTVTVVDYDALLAEPPLWMREQYVLAWLDEVMDEIEEQEAADLLREQAASLPDPLTEEEFDVLTAPKPCSIVLVDDVESLTFGDAGPVGRRLFGDYNPEATYRIFL